LSILIIVPIIVLYIGFSDLFLKMFFSAKFLSAKKILDIAIYAMFFKSVSFCMGYIILAKADSKIFTKTAIGFSFLNLTLSIIGYHYYGLEGIGVVFLLYYFLHFLIVSVIIRNRYKISLLSETFKIFIIGFVICVISFLFNNFFVGLVQQVLFIILILTTLLFSIIEINKRMSLIPFLDKIFKKNDKKNS
jgi:O-antigen/teichoic acid export membrane protein